MKFFLPVFLLLLSFSLFSQKKYTISGYISEADSGEKLIASSVFDTLSLLGTVSNNYGFYSLTLDKGPVALEVSYIGHKKALKDFYLRKDIVLDFNLDPINELETIEIIAEKQSRIENNQ